MRTYYPQARVNLKFTCNAQVRFFSLVILFNISHIWVCDVDISKHLPPQQKARLLKKQTIGGPLTGYRSTIQHQPRGYTR